MKFILVAIALSLSVSGFAKSYCEADSLITPGKDQISKSLVQLRDSIDMALTDIEHKAINSSPRNKQLLNDADKDLKLHRATLEKMIEEVVIANGTAWNDALRKEALSSLSNGRSEYQRVQGEVKELLLSKENSYK